MVSINVGDYDLNLTQSIHRFLDRCQSYYNDRLLAFESNSLQLLGSLTQALAEQYLTP
jgi:hypothetical protein